MQLRSILCFTSSPEVTGDQGAVSSSGNRQIHSRQGGGEGEIQGILLIMDLEGTGRTNRKGQERVKDYKVRYCVKDRVWKRGREQDQGEG